MTARSPQALPSPPPAARSSGASPAGSWFYQASLLARQGQFAEALRFLERSRQAAECSEADVLDLQARIYAQQGMYLRAEACWLEALEHDPGNRAYIDGLAELHRAHDPMRWLRLRLYLIALAVVLVTGFGLLWLGYQRINHQQEAALGRLTKLDQVMTELAMAHDQTRRDTHARLDSLDARLGRLHEDTTARLALMATSAQLDTRFREVVAATQASTDRLTADAQRRDELRQAQRREDQSSMDKAFKETRAAADASIRLASDAQATRMDKAQADLLAALKAQREAQAAEARAAWDRQDRLEKDVVRSLREASAHADASAVRSDQSLAALRDQAQALREQVQTLHEQINRVFWFRWPTSTPKPSDQAAPAPQPATRPAG